MPDNITPITRRDDETVAAIRADLEAHGQARAVTDAPDVWRKLARRAARELGRPVRTVHMDGITYAQLRDWPATPAEESEHQERLRRVVDAANGATTADAPAEVAEQVSELRAEGWATIQDALEVSGRSLGELARLRESGEARFREVGSWWDGDVPRTVPMVHMGDLATAPSRPNLRTV